MFISISVLFGKKIFRPKLQSWRLIYGVIFEEVIPRQSIESGKSSTSFKYSSDSEFRLSSASQLQLSDDLQGKTKEKSAAMKKIRVKNVAIKI